jgi:hypothetical protein
MGTNLERRLARLEPERPQCQKVFIWRDCGKTAAEAVAARYPHGVPDNIELWIFEWKEPGGEIV